MSVIVVKGDLMDASENIIGHQVNCQSVMGSGVAKQIRELFPIAFEQYTMLLRPLNPRQALGRCQIVFDSDKNKYIANLFGQLTYGRNKNTVYTNYDAMRAYLWQLKVQAQIHSLSIALPYNIGCGCANGDWDIVLSVIEEIFNDYDVTLYSLE